MAYLCVLVTQIFEIMRNRWIIALTALLPLGMAANAQPAMPRIGGTINFRYQVGKDLNSFDIRRARLDVRGDLAPDLGYRVQVELAGSPKIVDAFMQWKVRPAFGLQAGQFKVPFTIENPYSPANLETIDNSLIITSLVEYNHVSGASTGGRDIGLSASGSAGIFDYAVGVFNGSGVNRGDNNKGKDVAGTLTLRPVSGLSVAAFHYNGPDRVRTGGGVKYDDGKWLARGEYLEAKTNGTRSRGAYAVGGLFVTPRWQPVAKVDWLLGDVASSGTRQINYTAGVNWLPLKNVKVQLNYSYRTSPVREYHYAALQLMGMF